MAATRLIALHINKKVRPWHSACESGQTTHKTRRKPLKGNWLLVISATQ